MYDQQLSQLKELKLTSGRFDLIKQLLSVWDTLSFTAKQLTVSERFDIQKIVAMPEWKSLEKYYEIITSEYYKRIVEDGDVHSARNVISLLVAFKNRSKTKGKFYAQENLQTHQNQSSQGFSKQLKEDGEEFI